MSEAAVTPPETPPADIVSMKQTELEALVASRIGAALAAASKKQPVVPDTIQKELDDLRAKEKERERADLERRGEYTKALESQATSIKAEYEPLIKDRDEKLAKGSSKLREVIVTNALLSAAADGNAVAPSQVVKLLESRVKLNDEMQPVVYDDNGNPAFVGSAAMTPAQLMEGFLRENPHFVKAAPGKSQDAKGGPGAKGAGDDDGPLAQKAKEVAALQEQAAKTGSPRDLAKHAAANRELKALQAKGA